MHSHLTKANFKARKRYLFFSLKRYLQKRKKGTSTNKQSFQTGFETCFKFYWFTDVNHLARILFWLEEKNMADYMESNITVIRNLVEDNKMYKHVGKILRQNFPEVTRGITERFRQFCLFTKRSTLLLEKSRKVNFLDLFFIEQYAKFLPFLLMRVE